MKKSRQYDVVVTWTGKDGTGTQSYEGYRRDHVIEAVGKPAIAGSSDAAFRGVRLDSACYSPAELRVASLSACHILEYLHLCADNGVVVADYRNEARGVEQEEDDGGEAVARVVLKRRVTIAAGGDRAKPLALQEMVHRLCFIARSMKLPVEVESDIVVG